MISPQEAPLVSHKQTCQRPHLNLNFRNLSPRQGHTHNRRLQRQGRITKLLHPADQHSLDNLVNQVELKIKGCYRQAPDSLRLANVRRPTIS